MKSLLILAGTAVLASGAFAAGTPVFQVATAGTYFTGSHLADNEAGELFTLADSSNAPINSFDIAFDSIAESTGVTANTYSDLQLEVTFFSGGQTAFTGSGAEFTGAETTYTVDFGAGSYNTGFYYTATGINLSVPQAVSGNLVGAQFTWVNNVNGVLSAATGIQTGYSIGNAPTVGGNAQTGYNLLWAAGGATNSNISLNQSSYIYTGNANQDLSVNFYAAPAPEPISTAIVVGALGTAIARRRRNRA